MARNTIPKIIAILSTCIHVSMTFYMTYALVQLIVIITGGPVQDQHDKDSTMVAVGGFGITILIISLLLEIPVLIVSIYLIVGVIRELQQFIAPWVYLTGIYTILSFVGLIKGSNALDVTFAIKVILIIIHAAMWYPVFRYWRNLKTNRNTNFTQNSPLYLCSTTLTPSGGVCNAGNLKPGQMGENDYPSSGNSPRIATGASYNRPQYDHGGQKQLS